MYRNSIKLKLFVDPIFRVAFLQEIKLFFLKCVLYCWYTFAGPSILAAIETNQNFKKCSNKYVFDIKNALISRVLWFQNAALLISKCFIVG